MAWYYVLAVGVCLGTALAACREPERPTVSPEVPVGYDLEVGADVGPLLGGNDFELGQGELGLLWVIRPATEWLACLYVMPRLRAWQRESSGMPVKLVLLSEDDRDVARMRAVLRRERVSAEVVRLGRENVEDEIYRRLRTPSWYLIEGTRVLGSEMPVRSSAGGLEAMARGRNPPAG